jgi:hypothetical protein
MSSAVVSTSAALGRHFVFDEESAPEVYLPSESTEGHFPHRPPQRIRRSDLSTDLSDPRLTAVTPASKLEARPLPDMVSSGIPAVDALTGGLPRGCLSEICGPTSSGRTTMLLAALAAATRRGEYCAVIDASDALDPHFTAAAGVDLDRLLWVRCGESPQNSRSKPSGCPILAAPSAASVGHPSQAKFNFASKEKGVTENSSRQSEHRLEQVLRATDLLLESGGFGLIILDLADLPLQSARRIPLTTWFRFRRAVEHKPTILLVVEQHPIAGSCSSLLLKLGSPSDQENVRWERSESSREAATWDSPARECHVAVEKTNESRRDGTISHVRPTHAHLLTGLDITAELIRSRLNRKPAHSVMFATKTAWVG